MTDIEQLKTDPGLILKAAREEMSWSQQRVAQELRLRVSIIAALEENDFSSFESVVFLRGYFKSYCRLVNLHEERMTEILEKKLSDTPDLPSQNDEPTEAILGAKRHQSVMPMIIVAFVCIFLAYSYFLGDSNEQSPSEEGVISEQGNAAQLTSQNTQISETPPEPDTENAGPDVETTVAVDETAQSPSLNQSRPSSDINDSNLSPEAQEQAVPNLDLDKVESSIRLLEATFSGDCWVELEDGDGKRVYARLFRSGQSFQYQGKLPYRILIGNAQHALLKFNGEAIDLAPYTADNNRALLVLNNE